MAQKTIISNIQLRNDTAENWVAANPVLLKGECGVEYDTHKFKFGDGATAWKELGYAGVDETQIHAVIAAADATIAIGGTATAPTVKVQLSPDEDNAAKATANGLKVTLPTITHPEYSIAQLKAPDGGMSASYSLTKDGVNVGAIINIPKDMVVKSGSVVVNPQGQSAGTYIELVLANAAEDKLYVKVDDLIEYVTSGSQTGDMIVVSIDADHKVTASITDGTVTEAKLTPAARARMAGVTNVATGTTNGTINVTFQTFDTETKHGPQPLLLFLSLGFKMLRMLLLSP